MTKVQQWVGLTALAVLLVVAAGWSLVVAPQRDRAAQLRANSEQQVSANARVVTQLAVLRAQARDLPQQRERLEKVAAKIPAGPALPELVRALADAASESGVEFVSLVPAAAGSPTGASAGTVPGPAPAADALQVLPVTINVVGAFYDVEQYVNTLERLPRALRVTSLVVTSSGNPATGPAALRGSVGLSSSAGTALSAVITGQVFFTATDTATRSEGAQVPPVARAAAPGPAGAPVATAPPSGGRG